MDIYVPRDVENDIRLALSDYLTETVYVRPLPADLETPCIEVSASGGTESETIDTWTVVLDSRAENEDEAMALLRKSVGLVKAIAKKGETPIRHAELNTLGSWGEDSSRPDLAMCSATLQVVVHEDKTTI